jgi:endoribonuclease Dicer
MATPGNPRAEIPINGQKPYVIIPGKIVDSPATEAAAAEQDCTSSGDSDDDDAKQEPADDRNHVTKRRRAQNAQFEAL